MLNGTVLWEQPEGRGLLSLALGDCGTRSRRDLGPMWFIPDLIYGLKAVKAFGK